MNRKPRSWYQILPAVLGLLLVAAPAVAGRGAAGKGELIFEIHDPRGDDHGNGRLEYPIRSDYQKGDLDLVTFAARRVAGGTQFEATFSNPIRRADRQAIDDLGTTLTSVARHGFYTFNVDVYVDRDRAPGSGWLGLLPGRLAEVSEDFAWDRAVVLTPRPTEARSQLKEMMMKALTQELRSGAYEGDEMSEALAVKREIPAAVEERIHFSQRVRIHGSKVCFFVPDEVLGGPARADWAYLVVVSGADLIQSFDVAASYGLSESRGDRLAILPVSPGKWQDRFGGGREMEALQPPLVDILVPPGESQERLLSDFDSLANRPARLLAVVPAELERDSEPSGGLQGAPGR